MRGQFITLEGIEGCGKTIQIGLLARFFEERAVPCRMTREPGGTAFGREVRKILLRHDAIKRQPVSELLLYLADRYQHIQEVVLPALSEGLHVLSDRYHDATVAYQGFARGIPLATIRSLADTLELPTPDLTLILDIDVNTGLERARRRNSSQAVDEFGRFEAEELQFHRQVREAYHKLALREPGRMILVPADGAPEEVCSRLVAVFEQRGILPRNT